MVNPEDIKYKRNGIFIYRFFNILEFVRVISFLIKFNFNDIKDIFSPLFRWIDSLLKLLT